jgi:RNA polymerase sigma-70 factor (sigma-E family)
VLGRSEGPLAAAADRQVGPDFEEFVAARSRSLFRTAYLLTDSRESAEDLLQTALEKAFPRWRRIRRAEQPEAYVRKMIVNLANDAWRKRRGVVTFAWDDELDDREPAADPADAVVARQVLIKALRSLPFQMRAVLVLRHWEGLPEREAAELLGCSVGNVKSQASRGLVRLREALGVDPAPPSRRPEYSTAAMSRPIRGTAAVNGDTG